MSFLLDTNLLSEPIKKRPDPAVLERLGRCRADELHTSAVCVMELRFGALRHPDSARLWSRIQEEILSRVSILAFGPEEALEAAEILATLQSRGEPLEVEDIQIAATARAHGLTVVTRNLRHFERIPGLTATSWWPQAEP